jgi:Zn-dependent protease
MDFSNLFHFEWSSVPFRMIAFVIAFSLHEWAHAFVAWRLGDNTAKNEGRLTINPIPHIDPFGLILILFGPFGWAKPVPINPFNFKGNKRLGIVFVSVAGPLINLILAFVFALVTIALLKSSFFIGLPAMWKDAISQTLFFSVMINCGLLIFNLLPIPPLDGSKIFRFLAPSTWEPFFYKLEMYGPWILLLLIFLPSVGAYLLGFPVELLAVKLYMFAGDIFGIKLNFY